MTTATKNFYAGIFQGEVVCVDCAGVTLQSAIQARPYGINFQGISDVYQILSADEVAEYSSLDMLCECN